MAEIDPGTEIAGYRIESVIGRGGMAVVYRAEDTRLGRKVALKLLTPALAENEQFQQRFIRESRLAASLDHPNIVPIYEAGESDGHLFIAMRYVPGSDLKALLNREGALPSARILRLFVQIGDALDAAHVLGLVHRDVKPGNILITSVAERSGHAHPDHVYLTDFGLTKRTTSLSGSLTGTGHFLGTVDYVSPEQIQGAPVGPSTDIYALGCVLYECLTGRLPFSRDDDAAVLWAHLVEMPPPVSAVRPELPAAVDEVVAKAVAKAPEDRYDSCRDLVRDLEYALGPSMDLPAASHAGGRQGARHGRSVYPLEDRPGAGDPTGTGPEAAAAPLPGAQSAQAPEESGETVRWVSHPSLPPGAIAPPRWGGGEPTEGEGDEDVLAAAYGVAGERAGEDQAEEAAGYPPEEYEAAGYEDQADEGEEYGPEDQEYGAEGYEGEPGGDRQEAEDAEAGPAAPPAGGGRRRKLVVVGVALAVVALLAVGAFLWLGREESLVRFANRDAIIPFSLNRPESWTARAGAAADVVLSPRPDEAGDAFLETTDRWAAPRELLATSPGDATGVYAYTQASGSDTSIDGLKNTIQALLGQDVKVDFAATHRQLRVGGQDGHEFEGVVSDPQATGTRLSARFDVVLPETGGLVLLTFFTAPDDFDSRSDLFTTIRDSVTFDG
ncbi:serine/threonine-protein kinase [Knoellia sp. p5-6-4]|uniref:serine/threonine-protein kinase n=1 Tax=unclassified Knoellia TaxID=2618719 RepID=UPI0023D9CF3B|nr:serine/threonine-protein kinase [Knoellia sp. p5-6-4]MDF2145365.1 protein kinase [Knoellia sp. p5-6-4]